MLRKESRQVSRILSKTGLEVKKRSSDRLILYLNWYRIDLVAIDTENSSQVTDELDSDKKGEGVFLYFSVDNVDEAYEELVKKRFKPITEPKDMSWGSREFIITDPDGYKLVLFKRKVAKNPTD
ncbi:MAG TPA: VOC family protein [Candidatus Saccharimonadales bacterium]